LKDHPENENYFRDDYKVVCIYWLAGVIKEVAAVEDILTAGKHSKTVKPVLMAVAVYKKEASGSGVREMRMFFLSARDRQRISHTKEKVVRRIANGVFVPRPPQARSYDSDDSASESDDDDEPESNTFGDNSDDDSDSEDDARRPRRQKVGYEMVPQVFRRNPTGASATASEELDATYYVQPVLSEMHGLNRKMEVATIGSATGAGAAPTMKHFHNVAVEFSQLVARLIEKHNFDFKLVKSSAIVRLQGNHFIYRERTYDAEFDILETRGSSERANELLSFEKEDGKADDDLTEPVVPFRLEPATLPGSM